MQSSIESGSQRTINTLIVGTGVGGKYHINAQKKIPGVNTVLFDQDPVRLQQASEEHGLRTARSLEAGIEAADLVIISTPDHLHTHIALQAIKAGKKIYIEKPMATNQKDAYRILNAAVKHGVEGWVGTGYRLTPAFEEVHRRVKSGDLGRLIHMQTSYMHDMRQFHASTPWREQHQNYLYGAGSHAVDLAWWVGGRVDNVVGTSRRNITMPNYKWPEAYDLTLELNSGALATVTLDARSVQPQHGSDLKVWGETGRIVAHNKIPSIEVFHEGDKAPATIQTGSAYTADIANNLIIASLRGERPDQGHLPGLHEATLVMDVLHAGELAVKHGRRVPVRYYDRGPNLREI